MADKRVLDPCCGRDVREKLVELFRNAFAAYGDGITGCTREEFFADFIAGYGGTVQEWISVKDRLPQQDEPVGLICEQVQVILSDGFVTTGWCNRSHKAWYYLPYGDTHFIGDSYENTPVIAWQPLAQPPKGE